MKTKNDEEDLTVINRNLSQGKSNMAMIPLNREQKEDLTVIKIKLIGWMISRNDFSQKRRERARKSKVRYPQSNISSCRSALRLCLRLSLTRRFCTEANRSEERRVGKEGRTRRWGEREKEKE